MSTAQTETVKAQGATRGRFLEEVLFSTLGPIFGGKFYPDIAPDGTLPPYGIQAIVANVPENTLANGRLLRSMLVQIDIYGTTRNVVRELGLACNTAIDGLITGVFAVQVQGEQTLYENDVRLHRVLQEYMFMLPSTGGVS